jgi:hypothetical protein
MGRLEQILAEAGQLERKSKLQGAGIIVSQRVFLPVLPEHAGV